MPGSRVALSASLSEYGVPHSGHAQVKAEIVFPDGGERTLRLDPDGPGRYAAGFTASIPGLYRVRVRARGATRRGSAFTREKSLTASVFVARKGQSGPCDPPTHKPSLIRRLLDWLFGSKRRPVIDSRALSR